MFRIQFSSKENVFINNFLCRFFKKCKHLMFIKAQDNQAGRSKQGIGLHLNALSKISHRITTEVWLRGFKFNNNHLKRIFNLFKHIKKFELRGCKLSLTTSPDLSRVFENSALLDITCDFSQTNENKNEDQKLKNCENFISALAKSDDLKRNLKFLNVSNSMLSGSNIDILTHKYEFYDLFIS